MPERFTPDELKLLVESGDLTENDLLLLDKADARVAGDMMIKGNKIDVKGDMPMPPMGAKAIAAAGSISQAIMTGLGIGGSSNRGGGGKLKPGVPPNKPFKTPNSPDTVPNLERHGNLTRPGPDAHKGGGGPSRPSGPVRNPATETTGFKGPTGDDSNFKDVPRVSRPTQSVGAELNKGDRRSASRNSEMYEAMKAGLPDSPGAKRMRNVLDATRKSPTHGFDEADKRKVEFGGLNPSTTGYRRPQDRKPLSKREIEQLIANILKLSE